MCFCQFMYFLRILFLSIVFIGYSSSIAGVFEDYWAAVRKDNPDKVLQLLLAGFDPNTVDDKGNTALILSLSEGGLKVADVMLSLDQVEVNRVNRAGESALMVASRRGHEDMVRKLIAREATVNMTGWTPLHHAAAGGQVKIMQILLQQRANFNAPAPNGNTPLMMAAGFGSAEAVKLLLDEGAVATTKNRLGVDALGMARLHAKTEAIRILTPLTPRPPQGSRASRGDYTPGSANQPPTAPQAVAPQGGGPDQVTARPPAAVGVGPRDSSASISPVPKPAPEPMAGPALGQYPAQTIRAPAAAPLSVVAPSASVSAPAAQPATPTGSSGGPQVAQTASRGSGALPSALSSVQPAPKRWVFVPKPAEPATPSQPAAARGGW